MPENSENLNKPVSRLVPADVLCSSAAPISLPRLATIASGHLLRDLAVPSPSALFVAPVAAR
jgi:hypothetical protein